MIIIEVNLIDSKHMMVFVFTLIFFFLNFRTPRSLANFFFPVSVKLMVNIYIS